MRADADILAKFVMRAAARAATLDEAKTHRDVVLSTRPVRCRANRAAHHAPPQARVRGVGVAECAARRQGGRRRLGARAAGRRAPARLLAALASRTRGAPRLYWGMFETMHWDDAVLRPAQAFSYGFGRSEACRRMVAPPSYPWRSYYNWTNKGGVVIHVLPTRMSRAPLVPSAAPWPSHRRHGATNGSADAFIGPTPSPRGRSTFSTRRSPPSSPPTAAWRTTREPPSVRPTTPIGSPRGRGRTFTPASPSQTWRRARGSRRCTSAPPPSSSPSRTPTAATAS